MLKDYIGVVFMPNQNAFKGRLKKQVLKCADKSSECFLFPLCRMVLLSDHHSPSFGCLSSPFAFIFRSHTTAQCLLQLSLQGGMCKGDMMKRVKGKERKEGENEEEEGK